MVLHADVTKASSGLKESAKNAHMEHSSTVCLVHKAVEILAATLILSGMATDVYACLITTSCKMGNV